MVRFLQMEGYEVIVAAGANEGLDKCRCHRPDVVLIDAHMPQMDGFAAVHELRRFSRVPVLMLSSGDTAIDRPRGLKAGANAYLAKPFSGGDLITQLHALLPVQQNRPGALKSGIYLAAAA
jgi:DNA-binding response OmpR family regulator